MPWGHCRNEYEAELRQPAVKASAARQHFASVCGGERHLGAAAPQVRCQRDLLVP